MRGAFADATAVTPDGDDRYVALIPEGWDIGGKANGGVLMTIAARAMAAAADRPDPVTVTAHYTAPGDAGALSIATDVLKAGRRLSTVSARVSQNDRALLQVTGAFGDLATMDGPSLVTATRPDYGGPDDCVSLAQAFAPALSNRIDCRLHPDDARFRAGDAHGVATMRGWFRLLDDEPIDVFTLLLAVDCFPPTIFNSGLGAGWTPTVELTAHVRRRPVGPWLQCQFTSRFIFGGFMEEDVEVWDANGLVAQARQLALVPLA